MTSIRDHIKKSPHRTRLETLLKASLPTLRDSILDIGSRNRRYDHLLKNRPIAVDIVENKALDVQHGDVTNLQFRTSTFDAVICLEVLEYVSDPRRAVNEIARVLKVGGTVVLSVPFMFKEHEDVQRYTGGYLKELLRDFDITQFAAVGGSWTVVLTIWWGKAKTIRFKPFRYFCTALLLPFLLCRSHQFKYTTYASGYFVVATKRS
jgi:SAM-dependent methyltransferase